MSGYRTDKCKGCGAEIIWGRLDSGKSVPLDAVAPVYGIEIYEGEVCATRDRMAHVSHFSTCPKANQFSGGKRTAQTTLFDKEPT